MKTIHHQTEYTEYFKQLAVVSENNIFQAVTNAAENNPEVKKIIILKQTPRYDEKASNPPGLKPFLSSMINSTIDQLWSECSMKNKIIIGNHNLECSGGIREERYRNIQTNMHDGVHLYGPSGVKAYTTSVMNILSSAQLVETNPPKYYDEYNHKTCNQARYEAERKSTKQYNQSRTPDSRNKQYTNQYQYTVPTQNRYAKFGNYNY